CPRRPERALYSTVGGGLAGADDFGASYWARNIRCPVRFAAAVETMIRTGCTAFVELSPHPVLAFSIKQCLEGRGDPAVVVSTLRRAEDEAVALRGAVGALYTEGCRIDWNGLYPERRRVVGLPSYPWQRERFWLPEGPAANASLPRYGGRAAQPNPGLLGR